MGIERLRVADPETAEQLWALQHAAYRREAELIGVADLPPLRDTVESLRLCGETFYGYVTDDGDIVGAVSTERESENEVAICRMMVHPDHARQGIGGKLLQHVIDGADCGALLTVTAEVRNEPAVRLYERFGFRPAGRLDPAPGIRMVRMTRRVE